MPFQRVEQEKLAQSVVRQIELLILRGILRPGERLPSERDLSEQLGVSRPSLREAVADLQQRGLLTSRAGAGVFVADVLGSAFSDALVQLFATHHGFHMAIIEASHNVVMLHMMRSMFQLLREGVFYNRQIMFRQRTTREALLDQHRAINSALQARDPRAARAAVEAHMSYVETALRDQQRAERHEAIALQRLEHEKRRT